MRTFYEALHEGFNPEEITPLGHIWTFKFGEGYELCFEPLLYDKQWYVALYKDRLLLTEKVVVKPGKE